MQNLWLVKCCCASDVQANADRINTELQIARGSLAGTGENADRLRCKALHIRLDRATVHGNVPEMERSVFI